MDKAAPKMSGPKIWFLIGVSGAGKTALIQALAKDYTKEDAAFLHFDAVGVPSPSRRIKDYGSGENWLRITTDEWIEKIKLQYGRHRMVILEGSINLDVLQDAIQKHHLTNYEILLIHCNKDVRRHRLIKLRKQPELVNPEMDNWEKCLIRQAEEMNISIFDTSCSNLETLIPLLKQKLGLD